MKHLTKSLIPASAGISFKHQHFQDFIDNPPKIGFVEVHSENYFCEGGPLHKQLSRIRADYPLSLHGVGLSLGSDEPLDKKHLKKLKQLIKRYQPGLVSDHISWSRIDGIYLNDLLPLPYCEEALKVLSQHVNEAQDYLGQQILMENPSTYLEFEQSDLSETAFIDALVAATGCGLILDVNNVFVSCFNLNKDPYHYFEAFPLAAVKEIHLAGPTLKPVKRQTDKGEIDGHIYIDTHATPVMDEVWRLYEHLINQLEQPQPTLIEWDADVPALSVLQKEADKAQRILNRFNRDTQFNDAA